VRQWRSRNGGPVPIGPAAHQLRQDLEMLQIIITNILLIRFADEARRRIAGRRHSHSRRTAEGQRQWSGEDEGNQL